MKKCRVDANARSEVGRRRCRRKGGGREGEERQRGVGTRLRRCRRARWRVGGVGCRLTERKMADQSVSACVSAWEWLRLVCVRSIRACGGHMSERGKRASSSEMRFNVSESCDDGAYDILLGLTMFFDSLKKRLTIVNFNIVHFVISTRRQSLLRLSTILNFISNSFVQHFEPSW